VTANLKILLLFENLNLLSACKPKLSVLSIAVNMKLFSALTNGHWKWRAGFDFGSLWAIIIWIIDDAEHDYETTTVIKRKGIYDYFLAVIHCKIHKTEGSI